MSRRGYLPGRMGLAVAASVAALAAGAVGVGGGPAVAATAGAPVAATVASAVGAISGTATAAVGGAGVSGVLVNVYDGSGDFVSSASTAADGTYSVTGLNPASYTVCFDASFASGGSSVTGYASQCYKGVAWNPDTGLPGGTTAVPVASGQTVTGIDAALTADGAIAGTVTAAAGGGGLAGVSVDVYDSAGDIAASASTAADGTYTVTGLAPSAAGYTVCFDASFATGGSSATGYQSQCYNGVSWSPGATPPGGTTAVPVSAGGTATGIGAALAADGGIAGTVTAAAGGGGLGGVDIDVYDSAGDFLTSAGTAADGTYTVTGLTPSATGYTVCFDASFATGGSSATGYQSQCYNGVVWNPGTAPPSGTTPVPVSAGGTATGISAALTAQGAISGTVTAAAGGGGIGDVGVSVYNQAGNFVTESETASDGSYTVTGLPPASYTVCFDASFATGGGSATGYASQCYKGVPWTPGAVPSAGATAVAVTSGTTATGIGAALTAQGAISGTVTAAAGGAGISAVSVDVYSANGTFVTSMDTASNGGYTITGLAQASYRVCFDASSATGGSSTTGYASQCYKGVPWSPSGPLPAGATAVPVTLGKTATGIGAALTAQGAISGTVTAAAGGAGISGVSVQVYGAGGTFLASADTASNGTYKITGLTPASYTVCFDASFATGGGSTTGYASQCYKGLAWTPGSAPPAGATAVPVTSGKTATGIGAALAADGAISGTVTAAVAGGSGVGEVNVSVYGANGTFVTSTDTAANGTYKITGLTPASYTVCFNASFATGGGVTTGYASQCYKGVAWSPGFPPPAGSTPVPVTSGKTATGIGAALVADGAIAGTVTAVAGGGPVAAATVDVYDPAGNFLGQASTATDGTYAVTGLSPSAAGYTVCFDATFATGGGSATGYQNQCYKNVPWQGFTLPAGTTPVPVAAGKTATGIDAALAADGAISGTVTAGISGGTGVSGVTVDVFAGSGEIAASADTASDGTYTVPGLAPAAYTVCFDPSEASGGGSATGYQGQCYQAVAWPQDSPPPSGTTPVPVSSGGTATGINAALAPAGGISGTVTAASGGAGVGNVDVRVFSPNGAEAADAVTSAAGQYSVTGLAPSVPYSVCFDATGATVGSSKTGYQCQCYDKVAWTGGFLPPQGVTPVSVAAGTTSTGINAALPAAGGISGTVTAASGGAALSNVAVDVSTSTGVLAAQVVTNSTGGYSVTGLSPSAAGYTVCFDASAIAGGSGGFESQCYKNVPWSPGTAIPPGTTAVPVTVGALSTASAKLASEPGISGTVTAAATGTGVPGVNVRVFDDTGAYLISATTGSNGKYTVSGLAQTGGGYIVCFDASAMNYASQCDGKVAWSGGYVPPVGVTPVQVSSASPATVNAALGGAGGIAGKVTGSDTGKGLTGVTVDVYDSGHSLFTSAVTGPDGTYDVTGLPSSAAGYLVCFDGSTAQAATSYASQCDHGVAWTRGSGLPAGATAVPVTAGKTTAGIGAVLPVTGSIAGMVTAAAGGAGLSGVSVDVYDSGGGLVGSAATGTEGAYVVTGLTPLTSGYTVCFDASSATGGSSATGYASQCYRGVTWTAGATPPPGTTPVPVSSGGTAGGVSAALAPDGAIAGTVRTSGGTALGGVMADVFDPSGDFIASAVTGSGGTYTVTGLAPLSYTVCFDASLAGGGSSTGYQGQCYNGVTWTAGSPPPSGVKPVPVTAGKTATGIGAALAAAGGISGSVTASGGGGVSSVPVDVFTSAGVLAAATSTASDGTYTVTGLVAAPYTVCFDASVISAAGLSSQCYKNVAWTGGGQPVPAGTTAVHVSAGAMTTGVSAALAPGASISGKVTAAGGAASGHGLAGVNVDVFDSHGTFLTAVATASDGSYTVSGLTPSATGYQVCFDASLAGGGSSTGYAGQCYRGVAWAGGTVPPTGTTLVKAGTGINAAVSPAGAISGTVTAKTGGAGLTGVLVRLYDSGGHLLAQQRTGAKGSYTLGGLAPSAGYRVCFDASLAGGGASATGYAGQCYRGVAWGGDQSAVPKAATAVPVTAGKTTTGVSAAMVSAASIGGTVTAAAGGAALTGVSVEVFNSSGTLVAATGTAANGTYTVTGLAAATYTVCFEGAFATGGSSAAGYAGQCYRGVAWSGTAAPPKGTTVVKVGADAAVKGVNAKLKNA